MLLVLLLASSGMTVLWIGQSATRGNPPRLISGAELRVVMKKRPC